MRLFFALPLLVAANISSASFFEVFNIQPREQDIHDSFISNVTDKEDTLKTVTRAPVCDADDLRSSLLLLGIDGVKTNDGLKKYIFEEYGESMWDALTTAHPYLKNKKGSLDTQTANWIIKTMMTTEHKRLRELVIPFNQAHEEMFNYLIREVLGNATKGHLSSRVIFKNEEMRGQFRTWLYSYHSLPEHAGPGQGRYWMRDYFTHLARKSPKYTGIKEELLEEWGLNIYDSLLDDKRVLVGAPIRPEGHKPVVEIWGHGSPGAGSIGPGGSNPDVDRVTAAQLVDSLMEQNILTKDTRLKIGVCYGGCGPMIPVVPFDRKNIEAMFQSGELQQYLVQRNGSFLQQVRLEVSQRMPEHSATIEGYLGEIYPFASPDVLHRDGTRKVAFSSGVTANDGQTLVHLNRKEMKAILHPGNLRPDYFLRKLPKKKRAVERHNYARWSCFGGGCKGNATNEPMIEDVYRLVDADSYGDFPASGESNSYWQYIGPRHWDSPGRVDDIYVYNNPHTELTEYFRLKHAGGQSTHFPVNQGSNESWDFLGTSKQLTGIEPPLLTGIIRFEKWYPNVYSNHGFFSRMNSDGTVADIYWLKKDDLYGLLPASKSDNDDFTYVGPRKWREAGNKGDIYRQIDPVTGKLLFYQLKNEDAEASAFPWGKSSNENWTFIGTLNYVTPEE